MSNFDKWLSRCHSLSKIMTNDKGKTNEEIYQELVEKRDKKKNQYNALAAKGNLDANMDKLIQYGEELTELNNKVKAAESKKDIPKLSQGCMSHLQDVWAAETYGRNLEIKSKFLEKGIEQEEESITLYSVATEEMYKKNKERKSNDYITGEIDFKREGDKIIRDTKTTWDLFDFRRKLSKPLINVYNWQDQGYMWLWDCEEARTIFTLVDTPKRLIEKEKKNLFYLYSTDEAYEKACEDLEKILTFADIPMEEKIIEFSVKRNEDMINSIAPRVEICREYLNSIKRINFVKDEF